MSKIKMKLNIIDLIARKTEIETYEAYVSLNMEMEEKECPPGIRKLSQSKGMYILVQSTLL